MTDDVPTIRWYQAMADIDPGQWDRLALPLATPLLEWQWLHQLERSGSIAPATGWFPRHLTVWQGDHLVGAAPFYIKTHSQGEFVFDHWWAGWAREAGIVYYPKLVGMSPATPSEGFRFMVAPGQEGAAIQQAMVDAIDRHCLEMGISGCHLLFVDPGWMAQSALDGFVPWRHQSFLWRNEGYRSFDDYLSRFKSSQRRNIRRERARMANMGITFRHLTGDAIPPGMAALMYDYYLNTNAQFGPWAARYLNGRFFDHIFATCRHRMLVVAAYLPGNDHRPVALSMLLHKDGTLIGRYWGCARTIKDLHFNMCFYEPIQWAIDRGITRFDPGAGSPHKIYRGFSAVSNSSLHRFYEPRLKALFARFIPTINQTEQAHIDELNGMLPFSERA